MQTLFWSSVPNATRYDLRIDDLADGWNGSCSSPNGDRCVNGLTSTSYNQYNFIAGHRYVYWVHGTNSCSYGPAGVSQIMTIRSAGDPVCGTPPPPAPPPQPNFTTIRGRVFDVGPPQSGFNNVQLQQMCINTMPAYNPGAGAGHPMVGMALIPNGNGYWLVQNDGGVFTFGVDFWGSTASQVLNAPIVGAASTPSGRGYWLVGGDGGVFSFGDAQFYGSMASVPLNKPVSGIARSPSGNGYWLVAEDGGVFAFGDAPSKGAIPPSVPNRPIRGIAGTPSGQGYWLVGEDGGVYAFGDAPFRGAIPPAVPNQPIWGIASTPSGNGYWLVGRDGGVFSFGDAAFYGSALGRSGSPIIDIERTSTGQGYYVLASNGEIYGFGDAFSPRSVDGNGNFSFPIDVGRGFCLRMGSGVPGGYTGPTLNSDYGPGGTSYENQVAGQTVGNGFDRNRDDLYDFKYNNASPPTATPVPPQTPWIKFTNSSFQSPQSVQNNIPASPERFAGNDPDDPGQALFIDSNGGVVTAQGFTYLDNNQSAKLNTNDWRSTDGYIFTPTFDVKKFGTYVKGRKQHKVVTTLGGVTGSGVWIIKPSGAITLTNTLPAGANIVLIVEGDVNITANFNTSDSVGIAVFANKITIAPAVTEVRAILVADTIDTGSADTGLKIRGNLVSFPGGNIAEGLLNKRTQNGVSNRRPSVFVVHDTGLYLKLLPYLSVTKTEWKQLQ